VHSVRYSGLTDPRPATSGQAPPGPDAFPPSPGPPSYVALVAVVFVTGMSGTGKSAALAELTRRGHRVVDTDYGGYAEEVPSSDKGGWEQLWREDRIAALLDQHDEGVLFLSGCVANQGKFYPRFDAIVLLSAPVHVILERVATRDTNDFGKSERERRRILDDLATYEPPLRAGATAEIDTRAPLGEVADALERIAAAAAR
jgi:shikimate kinase